MRKWHKGPPPSIGWWPASMFDDPNSLRWWNGKYWSHACVESNHITRIKAESMRRSAYQSRIKWTERPAYWPKRSRT